MQTEWPLDELPKFVLLCLRCMLDAEIMDEKIHRQIVQICLNMFSWVLEHMLNHSGSHNLVLVPVPLILNHLMQILCLVRD